MEQWMPVTNYEGYYEVSNCGSVRALERTIVRSDGVIQTRKARTKSLRLTGDGYLAVKLSKDSVDKIYYVHDLVAYEFIPGYFDGAEVNHIDFDRKNNSADNLEWVSHKENIQRTLCAGRHITQIRNMSGEDNPNYGNKCLSEKYATNPFLAKEKQSRPGAKNGRAKPISVRLQDGKELSFPYITACAKFLHDSGIISGCRVENMINMISSAAKAGKKYHGIHFEFR